MPYIITNPTWFSAFDNGDFEGGAGVGSAGGGGVSANFSSLGAAFSGTRKTLIDCTSATGGAAVNADGYDRQKNLVKLKSGNALVAGRRYQISVHFRVFNAGVSNASMDLALYCGIGIDGFPTQGVKIGDLRAIFGTGGYVTCTATINAPASVAVTDASIAFFVKWKQSQISPPIGGSGAPITGMIIYMDLLNIVESNFVAASAPVLTYNKTDVSTNGGADGSIDLIVTGGIGPFTYAWSSGQSTQDISGLAAGSYSVVVTDTGTGLTAATSVTITQLAPLTATIEAYNTTFAGANDGQLVVLVNGGSGNYSFLWNDAVTSQWRNSLAPGLYTIMIQDLVTGEQISLSATISDPTLAPKRGTFFYIQPYQAFRFVQDKAPDELQNFDNTLFCKMKHPGMWKVPYSMPACIGDVRTIQILSDYPDHSAELVNYSNVPIASFAVTRKLQLKDKQQIFDIFATGPGMGDGAGTTRIFFAAGAIPIPLSIDQPFVISNDFNGLNGTYTVQSVKVDATTSQEYILINKAYPSAAPQLTAKASFLVSLARYDVYEVDFDFTNVPAGRYYGRIRGHNIDGFYRNAESEPIAVRITHPDTNLVAWSNDVNKDRNVFTTGIIHKQRIKSQLYKAKPSQESDNYRQSDDDPIKLNSFSRRRFKWEIYLQPWFIHEALSLMFGYSNVTVNDVPYFSEEGPAEVGERVRYALNDNNIIIEEKGWLKDDDDDGVESGGGFLISQLGFVISQKGKIKA